MVYHMLLRTFHRWLFLLLFTLALLMPPVAIAAEDSSEFIQQWQIAEKWKGDFDGMVERRRIRVLVAHNKLLFFFDKARIRGTTYDAFREFETYINKKLKTGTRKIKVVFLPVPRDKLLPWLAEQSPDILCVQETKAHRNQLDAELLNPPGYHTYWEHPERKGYSGVVTFTKEEPYNIQTNRELVPSVWLMINLNP